MKDKIKNNLTYILLIALLFGAGIFYIDKSLAADCDTLTGEEKIACEEEKDDLEDSIDAQNKKLEKIQKEKEALEKNLGAVQGAVYSTQKAIEKTESEIETTEETIERKEREIENLNKNIEIKKVTLKRMIQESYYNSQNPMTYLFLEDKGFFDFMLREDSISGFRVKILSMLDEINQSKNNIEKEKNKLEGTKEEKESLLVLKEDQHQELSANKSQLQTKVNEKELDIQKVQAKLSKLKSELSSLLGEGYTVGDIEEAAKIASKYTGVRKDFLMGMLVVESDLGRYTGGCTYKESNMNETRAKIFKDICEELGYNYKKQKVSCPPSNYKGTGGAMGVAQFMSDTWMGYKSQISNATRNNPPDPWSLGDGVMAMALKLSKDGASSKSGECTAAKRYLGGSHQWYCDRVLYWADNYEKRLQ